MADKQSGGIKRAVMASGSGELWDDQVNRHIMIGSIHTRIPVPNSAKKLKNDHGNKAYIFVSSAEHKAKVIITTLQAMN